MKKRISFFVLILLSIMTLCGCQKESSKEKQFANKSSTRAQSTNETKKETLTIVATLFPQYDFAKQIAKDKANVVLLLPPGMESHSYEPTPGDIITIENSDLFLYTGDDMEPWASGIAQNAQTKTMVVNLSDGIKLAKESDEHHEEEHHKEEEHHHNYNPHIWTSPVLAMKMADHIKEALMKADPDNEAFYEENAAAYEKQLLSLHHEIQDIVAHASHKTVYIGSRFSLYYFMEEYGLSYVAAYDSCEEEAEPSIKRVLSMIKSMEKEGSTAIYYEELTEPYIANTIGEAVGATPLLFHSCHNVSKDDLEQGVTYLSLMKQNAVNLKKGLGK